MERKSAGIRARELCGFFLCLNWELLFVSLRALRFISKDLKIGLAKPPAFIRAADAIYIYMWFECAAGWYILVYMLYVGNHHSRNVVCGAYFP